MVGISADNLSPVQKDAVTVTRAVNLQYLWNDAFCIIQNEVDDWKEQSAELGSIYRKADFTIVSLVESNQLSFLNPVSHEICIHFQHPFDLSKFGYYALRYDGIQNRSYESYAAQTLSSSFSNNHWVTRGWTFQEQNFSQRMFAFGRWGVQFTCSSGARDLPSHFTEDPERNGIGGNDEEAKPLAGTGTMLRYIVGSDKIDKRFLHRTWRSFAAEYSGRVFTQPLDVFPALKSTAVLFQKCLEDIYISGIWKGDIIAGLLRQHQIQEPIQDKISLSNSSRKG
jgi:heterokaryon incompatibility protein (HET)